MANRCPECGAEGLRVSNDAIDIGPDLGLRPEDYSVVIVEPRLEVCDNCGGEWMGIPTELLMPMVAFKLLNERQALKPSGWAYLRAFLQMTQTEFAKLTRQSGKETISRRETSGACVMPENTEIGVRLLILKALQNTERFARYCPPPEFAKLLDALVAARESSADQSGATEVVIHPWMIEELERRSGVRC